MSLHLHDSLRFLSGCWEKAQETLHKTVHFFSEKVHALRSKIWSQDHIEAEKKWKFRRVSQSPTQIFTERSMHSGSSHSGSSLPRLLYQKESFNSHHRYEEVSLRDVMDGVEKAKQFKETHDSFNFKQLRRRSVPLLQRALRYFKL